MRQTARRRRGGATIALCAAGMSSCVRPPRLVTACEAKESRACILDPLVFAPEVIGPARIHTTLRWLPERLRPAVPIDSGDTFYVVESTPDDERVVARGRCPGADATLPIAIAHDRDGTIHALCIQREHGSTPDANEPVWPPPPARLIAHHGFARPGIAVSFSFDSRALVATEGSDGTTLLRPLLFSGFDGGGPYAVLGGTFMARAVKIMRRAGVWALAFRGVDAERLDIVGCGGESDVDFRRERLGAYALQTRTFGFDEPQSADTRLRAASPVFAFEPHAFRCIGSWAIGALPNAIAEDDSTLAFRVGSDRVGVVAGGHSPSSVDAWPASLIVEAVGNLVTVRKERESRQLWTAELPMPEAIETARVSCDDQRCVAAVVGREPGRDAVTHVFRFARPS